MAYLAWLSLLCCVLLATATEPAGNSGGAAAGEDTAGGGGDSDADTGHGGETEPCLIRPGSCPAVDDGGFGTCVDMCSCDNQCPEGHKCCSNGCGNVCLMTDMDLPAGGDEGTASGGQTGGNHGQGNDGNNEDGEAEEDGDGEHEYCVEHRNGVCPAVRINPDLLGPSDCADLCRPGCDNDCRGHEKCCHNGCGHQCMPAADPEGDPVEPEPCRNAPGTCPAIPPGVWGECAEFCSCDSDCDRGEKCCSNGCGHTCMRAEHGGGDGRSSESSDEEDGCPEDQPLVQCLVDPCAADVAPRCAAYPDAECRSNYCGGCNAEYYSPHGEILDCDNGGPYCPEMMARISCMAGLCDHEACSQFGDARCNVNYCSACEVQFRDSEGGLLRCGDPAINHGDCPPGIPPTPCFADPCDNAQCIEYPEAECRANYCGVCHAEFFNENDERVDCGNGVIEPEPCRLAPGTCPAVPDGVAHDACMEMCSCDNHCPIGHKCCSNGCGHMCMLAEFEDGGSSGGNSGENGECPDGQLPTPCFADPCGYTECTEYPEAECRANYCGGCHAEFFDENGRQVDCGNVGEPEPCHDAPGTCPEMPPGMGGICIQQCNCDNECGEGEKCCSIGCGKVCMGAVDDENSQGGDSGVDRCPEDMPTAACEMDPCAASSGCAAYPDAECRASYCGGCNAEYYSPHGERLDCNNGGVYCPEVMPYITCMPGLCDNEACSQFGDARCNVNFCSFCEVQFRDSEGGLLRCGDPNINNGDCPEGSPPTPCFDDPCSYTECHDYPHAKCRANYCGGCHAEFFNADGDAVDCGSGGNTGCPEGLPIVACVEDPCAVDVAPGCAAYPYAECRANYCGGCNAEYYSPHGERLDCEAGGLYCPETRAVIRCMNTCEDAVCPAYPEAPCNVDYCGSCQAEFRDEEGGLLMCLDNSECPPDLPPAPCPGDPCDYHTCNSNPDAECRPYFCGGCYAHFYDANGRRVDCEDNGNTGCPEDLPIVACAVDPCAADVAPGCAAYPHAECRANYCGGCNAEYYSPHGERLDCEAGGMYCPELMAVTTCLAGMCQNQFCSEYPEARCNVDFCGSCDVQFRDEEGGLLICGDDGPCMPAPGVCPAPPPGMGGICSEMCECDRDCPTGHKCCSNGCGHTCMPAEDLPIVEPEVCPNGENFHEWCDEEVCRRSSCHAHPEAECHPNKCGECRADWYIRDKYGFRLLTRDECDDEPYEPCSMPNPGTCPALRSDALGDCVESCKCDDDCELGTKCCSNGCGHACVAAEDLPIIEPEMCPNGQLYHRFCNQGCNGDDLCPGYRGAECEVNLCGGHECVPNFYVMDHYGFRQLSAAECEGPIIEPELCNNGLPVHDCREEDPCFDGRCEGYPNAYCEVDNCGGCYPRFFINGPRGRREVICEDNGGTNGCPPEDMVYCFVDPCWVSSCPAYPEATCESNYCGGCNADYYVDGDLVDCHDFSGGSHCDGRNLPGECPIVDALTIGLCVTECECDDECGHRGEGYKCCFNGCAHTCTAPPPDCPENLPAVQCFADVCRHVSCAAFPEARCRPSTCGSCHPEFYDEEGNILNCDAGPPGPCPPGVPMVRCMDPCTIATCPADPNARCVPNYCGACTAEWYSAEGNRVDCYANNGCPDDGPLITCTIDPCDPDNQPGCPAYPDAQCRPDCNGCGALYYSPQGERLDCDNGGAYCAPEILAVTSCYSNACEESECSDYPDATCTVNACRNCAVEYRDSEGGLLDCPNNPPYLPPGSCPPGVLEVDCVVDPCDTASCPAMPNAQCRPNYCGQCGAEFFDNNGIQVDCDPTDPDTGSNPGPDPVNPRVCQLVAPGSCPAPEGFGMCPEMCSCDEDCAAQGQGYKCCSNGCGHSCMAPVPNDDDTELREEDDECPNNDAVSDCDACDKQRCPANPDAVCRVNNCGGCTAEWYDGNDGPVTCQCPRNTASGSCPAVIPRGDILGLCANTCSPDCDRCQETHGSEYKCCRNECGGHVCQRAVNEVVHPWMRPAACRPSCPRDACARFPNGCPFRQGYRCEMNTCTCRAEFFDEQDQRVRCHPRLRND